MHPATQAICRHDPLFYKTMTTAKFCCPLRLACKASPTVTSIPCLTWKRAYVQERQDRFLFLRTRLVLLMLSAACFHVCGGVGPVPSHDQRRLGSLARGNGVFRMRYSDIRVTSWEGRRNPMCEFSVLYSLSRLHSTLSIYSSRVVRAHCASGGLSAITCSRSPRTISFY